MFKYFLSNNPNFYINKEIIDSIFKKINDTVNKKQIWIINIIFLDNNSIKKLNKNYRNINKTTDVLSFHYFDNFDNLKYEDIAGEIVMSEEKIILQWKEYWLWEEKEFYKLLIHSVLHILWYDHEIDNEYIVMQNLEKLIWKEVFEK